MDPTTATHDQVRRELQRIESLRKQAADAHNQSLEQSYNRTLGFINEIIRLRAVREHVAAGGARFCPNCLS
jgi:hypothetical protein